MIRTIIIVASMAAAPLAAQTALPAKSPGTCPKQAPPPAELAGWATMTPVRAAANAAPPTMLAIGTGAQATLLPASAVTYSVPPEKAGTATSHGGIFAFDVPRPGRYRIALGAGAWVDVVRDGKALASVGHGHGPDCTGIRKMVDFDLMPGRHLVQIAGNATDKLLMMVAKLTGGAPPRP